jgi:hypothetical protein
MAGFKFYLGLIHPVVRGFAAAFNISCAYAKYYRQENIEPVPLIGTRCTDLVHCRD